MSLSEKRVKQCYKKIAENIQKARLERGKTQLDIACFALKDVTDSYVSKLENNVNGKHFNLEHLLHIADYLDCDIKDFFNGVKK